MKELRTEVIFVPILLKSFNNLYGVIKNPKIPPYKKIQMIKAIMNEAGRNAKSIEDHISKNYTFLKPFSGENKIKLSFIPFYGIETTKTFNKKTLKSRKSPDRNPFDCVNYAPTIKSIEDKLVKLEILPEDNYKIIPHHETKPAIIDRDFEGHGIFVIIEEIEEQEFYFTEEMKEQLTKHKK